MRRVAHVLRKYDPAQWGGTETHVVAVTRRLADRGWRAEVHAPKGPTTPDRALPASVPLVRYRSFLPFLGASSRRRALIANAGNIASVTEPIRLLRDRALSLSHLHTSGRIGGGVRTAMRLTGRPYVVSVHGPMAADHRWLEEDTRVRLARTIDLGQPIGLLLGSRRVLDDAARVICFNEAERRALAVRVGDRAVRMDHGVDQPRLAAGNADRGRSRWPELGEAPLVTVVGRLAAQKNQLLALRAFAAGAPVDHHLVLAGATTDRGYRSQIVALAGELGIERRVHVLGNLDPTVEVPDLYAASKLLLVPSSQEAFGLIVLEGWASSLPVLFARRSGLADIADALGVDESAIVDTEPAAWAAALRRHLVDEGLRRHNVDRGCELVRSRYDWDIVTDRLVELYDEVLQGTT